MYAFYFQAEITQRWLPTSNNNANPNTNPSQVLYLSENSGSGRGLSGTIPSLFGTNMSEAR